MKRFDIIGTTGKSRYQTDAKYMAENEEDALAMFAADASAETGYSVEHFTTNFQALESCIQPKE